MAPPEAHVGGHQARLRSTPRLGGLLRAQAPHRPPGVDAREEAGLALVDVADPRHDALVHERLADLARGLETGERGRGGRPGRLPRPGGPARSGESPRGRGRPSSRSRTAGSGRGRPRGASSTGRGTGRRAAAGGRPAAGRQTPLIIRCECSTRPLAKRSRWCLPTASAAVTPSPVEPLGQALAREAGLRRLHAHQRVARERGAEAHRVAVADLALGHRSHDSPGGAGRPLTTH